MRVKLERTAPLGAAMLALVASCNLVQRPLPMYDPATAGSATARSTDAMGPDPSEDARGRTLWSEWRGADVVDREGAPVGEIADMRVDMETGAIAGITITTDGERALIVPFDDIDWARSDMGAERIALARTTAELPGSAPDVAWYAERERARLVGLVEAAPGATDTGRDDAVLVRLRDADNLVHRVLLRPVFLSPDADAWFPKGTELRVEGVQARDETGKLLVAASAMWDGRTLRLRGEDGAVRWSELVAPFGAAGSFVGRVVARDEAAYEVTDWRFDFVDGRIVEWVARRDGSERELLWEDVAWDGERGTWSPTEPVDDDATEVESGATDDATTGDGSTDATDVPPTDGDAGTDGVTAPDAQPEDASAPVDGDEPETPKPDSPPDVERPDGTRSRR